MPAYQSNQVNQTGLGTDSAILLLLAEQQVKIMELSQENQQLRQQVLSMQEEQAE